MALYSCTTARAEPPVVGPRKAGHRPANGTSDTHGAPSEPGRSRGGRAPASLYIRIARPTRGLEPQRQRGGCGEGRYPLQLTTRPAGGPAAAACDHAYVLCGRGTGEGRSPSSWASRAVAAAGRGVGFTCTSTAGRACWRAAPAPLAAAPGKALSVLLAPQQAGCAAGLCSAWPWPWPDVCIHGH